MKPNVSFNHLKLTGSRATSVVTGTIEPVSPVRIERESVRQKFETGIWYLGGVGVRFVMWEVTRARGWLEGGCSGMIVELAVIGLVGGGHPIMVIGKSRS